ncbi:MAG: CRISPR-associated endoribonuclease Cas6 [Candidatus Diapherotrites archaeon]|nr:CRISPR-associated endoribonuclease Cas6 [Candidatus Diapherotrites archaeon]
MLLASTILPLEGEEPPAVEHVRGWFYGLLKSAEPTLHDQQGLKPFTIGVLNNRSQLSVRITFLNEGLYANISPKLWKLIGKQLKFGKVPYKLLGVIESDHPYAKLSTYARLFQGEAVSDYPLRFASPTFFKRHGDHYPLPEPRLVFGSLLSRFAAFAPIDPPDDLQGVIDRLTLRAVSIRTRPIEHEVRAVGFTGRVVFHLPRASEEEARWLTALWRFAFFSGVGAKTTLGFGQAKPYAPQKAPGGNKNAQSRQNED